MGNYKGLLWILTLLVGTTAMLSTSSFGAEPGKNDDIVHPKLPITSRWLHLEGKDNANFTIFRKYTFVPDDKEVPIRNILMLNCAKDEAAYLDFVIPKQLPLKDLYGKEYIEKQRFGLVIAPLSGAKERVFTIEGKVKDNHIYIDFVGDQRKAIAALLRANRFRLFFDDFRRVEFVEMNDPKVFPNTGDGQTFDQMVDSLISTQYMIDMRPTIEQMLDSCPDIKEWNSLVNP